ncbi:MAG: tRNA (adenosine(37)-N6)-dimethylallyltransferase MiaA [Clostridiales bacterium]|nr:tRNA (adenosine(37)-N6)-dimethylallyltransferase MiaA [Clostridiales bacterium]
MKTFVGITGTTSVGKSAVAINLAKILKTEIISADSMQIYKGMNIGTAKVTLEEMQGITHHMLDIVEPNCNYSSFLYQQDVSSIIAQMTNVPIVVGGTGFYFDSLLCPPEFGDSTTDKKKELQDILATQGLSELQQMLKQIDERTYNEIDICNPKRVLRALEIAYSGTLRSQGKGKSNPRYNMILYVLQRNRQDLYDQIDNRVDCMIEQGLVNEVQNLIDKYGYCDTSAFSAIGYKEIIEYLQGKISLNDAIDKIKLNTRHYAKRQITYYKKMDVEEVIDVDGKTSEEIALYIYKQLVNKGIVV